MKVWHWSLFHNFENIRMYLYDWYKRDIFPSPPPKFVSIEKGKIFEPQILSETVYSENGCAFHSENLKSDQKYDQCMKIKKSINVVIS